MKLNLVIPAAGLGSRFRAVGINTPKPLIPVLDFPMIGWVIANFSLNDEDDIWMITRKEDQIPEQMENTISKIKNRIHFIEIDESYIQRDSNQDVTNVVEKVVVSDEATVGVYGWKSAKIAKNSIAAMKKDGLRVNGEFYVAPSYTYLLKNGGKISTYSAGDVETDVHGLGTPEDLKLFLLNSNVNDFQAIVRSNLGIRP
jgi:NDP-sugar pyrophosphorylase family protein